MSRQFFADRDAILARAFADRRPQTNQETAIGATGVAADAG